MRPRDLLKEVIPLPLLKLIRCWQLGLPKIKYERYKRIRIIKKENHATVVFLISSLPMWRYQDILEVIRKDIRFSAHIVFTPFAGYNNKDKVESFRQINSYFKRLNIPIINCSDCESAEKWVREINPDIIFYPQQYPNLFRNKWDYQFHRNRLICFVPYGLYTLNVEWAYRSQFNTIGWRMYYASAIHKRNARKYSNEFGRNVRIVGEPHADLFLDIIESNTSHVNEKKRVIYAPHFRIIPNDMLYRPSFLWTSGIMLELAKQYENKLHFVFKPHPKLFTELCKHKDWGEEKARAYYAVWDSLPNTEIQTGEFIELFKSSDALIHDCGSFTAEYQYTKKPCMFLTRDEESVRSELCEFGLGCLENHYIGKTKEDVVNFIENVVLSEQDPKKHQREQFFNDYLLPPCGMSTAENVYNDLVTSLFQKQ